METSPPYYDPGYSDDPDYWGRTLERDRAKEDYTAWITGSPLRHNTRVKGPGLSQARCLPGVKGGTGREKGATDKAEQWVVDASKGEMKKLDILEAKGRKLTEKVIRTELQGTLGTEQLPEDGATRGASARRQLLATQVCNTQVCDLQHDQQYSLPR